VKRIHEWNSAQWIGKMVNCVGRLKKGVADAQLGKEKDLLNSDVEF
jgi:hypothetical protein